MDQPERAFLEVETSVSGQRWTERASRRQLGIAEQISEAHNLGVLLSRVLAARDVSVGDAPSYLTPTLRDLLPDPSTLTAMDAAVARLVRAIESGEQVAIFGDYDVDGATSSALLARFLRHCGLQAKVYIPDRIFEGYGPNEMAIRELVDEGATLLVTVDCGSTSHVPLALASDLGCDVIVIDHHQVGVDLPEVEALVNPNRHDDLSGQGHLCAAGVVFITLVGLNRALRQANWFNERRPAPNLMNWLDLVALGTVCDVVPLIGVNRAFVTRGLQVMQKNVTPGLTALARAARQDGPPAAWHLGFLLGPRINAGGRIGDASLGARLLLTSDSQEAEEIALQLDSLNRERQLMEQEMLKQAIDEADAEIGLGDGPAVLVTERETWHAGVVGLLASRLKDRYRRPAFAIAFNERDTGSGSGRSISGVDLGKVVRAAVEEGILVKGGGHAMAAGITIKRDKLAAFRAFLEEQLAAQVNSKWNNQELKIDGALSARAATVDLFDQLQQAGPFGAGNPQPIFAFPNHVVRYAEVVGDNHVRFSLGSSDGAALQGIGFRIADQPLGELLLAGDATPLHVAGTLSADFYRGSRRIQLRPLDASRVSNRI